MPKESRKLPLCKTSLQHPASLPPLHLRWSTCFRHRYDEAKDCERYIITILYSVISLAFSYVSCPKGKNRQSSHHTSPSARIQQHNLAVALATISLFRVISFERVATSSDKDNRRALLLWAFDGSIIIIVKSGINFSQISTFVTVRDGDIWMRCNALRSNNQVSHHGQIDFRRSRYISGTLSHTRISLWQIEY